MLMTKTGHRTRGCRLTNRWFARGSLFFLLLVVTAYCPAGDAEPDDHCLYIETELTAQLSRKFKRSDKRGLAERRRYLNELFGTATRSCGITLVDKLVDENQDDLTLYRLFHNKLARPTREELLNVLDHRISYAYLDDVKGDTETDSPQNPISQDETESDPAMDQAHETDIQCMQVQDDLTTVLSQKYSRSDTEGLYQRRQLLNKLVSNTTPGCATTLKKRLGESRNGSELSELFHYKLAAPTRKELLDVLDRRSGSHASVIEGDIEIGITPEQISAAAQRAKRILADTRPTNDSWRSLERLQCIVDGIDNSPKTYNDSYYPVAPAGTNVLHTDNPWTCYKEPQFLTRKPRCREGESVIDHCRSSFAQAIVNANIAGESDEKLLELMLDIEDEINRGLAYFGNMRNIAANLAGSKDASNTMMCKSAAKFLVPRMSSSNSQDRLYNCYPDP